MKVFGLIKKPFEDNYFRKQLERFWNREGFEERIRETFGDLKRIEIIVHENATPMLERLGSEGIVDLFYAPNLLENVFAVHDKGVSVKNFGLEEATLSISRYTLVRELQDRFEEIEKYRIHKEEVSYVFGMIRSEENPGDIVEYLKTKRV